MDTAVVQQFLNVFQDYIDLCQSENWPHNETSEQELRNAFVMSQHIEKSLNRLQKKRIIDEFLLVLYSYDENPHCIIKNCLLDPPKYVLKKVINSNTKIDQMDKAFKLFLEMFSEDVLEKCLTDLMLEAASKETLLNNLTKEVEKDKLLKFKSAVLLSELSSCDMSIAGIVSNCNLNTAELLVFCMLNTELRYAKAVQLIKDTIRDILFSKNCIYRDFLRLLFEVNNIYFIEMCVNNYDIYKLAVEALLDCGKLLREGMSADSFYIDLGKSELESIVKQICNNDCLKSHFFYIVDSYDTDKNFWQNML